MPEVWARRTRAVLDGVGWMGMTKYDGLDLLDSLAEPQYKIGDIAFVREEAEKGKTIPVMVVGIDYDVNAAYL